MSAEQLYQLWDSAIKIGLGAFIALVGGSLARRHDFQKETFRRRQDAIEKVVEEFELVQKATTNLNASLKAILQFGSAPEFATKVEEQVKILHDANRSIEDEMRRLGVIQGKLVMLGLDACANAIAQYADQVELSSIAVLEAYHGEATQKKVLQRLEKLNACRFDFYRELRKAYTKH